MTVDDREHLRQRLYRPAATAEDVAAYAATDKRYEEAGANSPPLQSVDSGSAPRRRTWLRFGGFAALTGGAVAVLALFLPLLSDRRVPVLEPDRAPIPVMISADERADLLTGVRTGSNTSLSQWLARTSGSAPGALTSTVTSTTVARHGIGPSALPLRSADSRRTDGHLTVFIVTDRGTAISWLARSSFGKVLDVQGSDQTAGVPSVGALTFDTSERPQVLEIHTSPGVKWSVVAAFST